MNRAVALGMADGPARGLEALDGLCTDPSLTNCHLVASVRGDLLMRLGKYDEAREEICRAAQMTQNTRERNLLLKKIERMPGSRRMDKSMTEKNITTNLVQR